MDSHSWPCPTCAEERVFIQPPCPDGCAEDGGECPEWACVDCGTALLVGGAAAAAPAPLRSRAA